MNDDKLDRYLRSVGKECFVKYFGELFNESYSNQDVADLLNRKEDYTDGSCRSRVSKARRIIKAGRARDALREISRSARVPESVRDQAMQIAANLR